MCWHPIRRRRVDTSPYATPFSLLPALHIRERRGERNDYEKLTPTMLMYPPIIASELVFFYEHKGKREHPHPSTFVHQLSFVIE